MYLARALTDRAAAAVADLGRPVVGGSDAPPDRDALHAGLAGAAAAVVTVTERVDAAALDAAGPALRVVATVSVGFDHIDVAAAAERGVVVTNTPGVLDRATADHAFALVLAVCRRVAEGDRLVRSGQPWVWGPRMLVGLDVSAGATLGIVGYGRIGQAVARRARAFDMTVLAASPSRRPGTEQDGVTFGTLEQVLADSDVVSVHTPLTPTTRHLIDAAALATMRPGGYLVNTARGGVVDEDALVDALRSGRLRGAALDVFVGEPRVDPRLLEFDQVVLTPHTASAGEATRDAMGLLAVRNVADVLAGRAAPTPVPGSPAGG
ncbi:D-glycerate dehydrogenase [Nakamurella sp. YIM 132084]|uniref:D-glycerate dehydrogenase n=1 Tax=Nakamurella leprariae TaxID=2803911 RepID=A0A939C3I3_9ACTN|nr:D-glycerate dehydrogenase [Nakamurella leprariae]